MDFSFMFSYFYSVDVKDPVVDEDPGVNQKQMEEVEE